MIDKLKYATISQIYTKKLFFYDSEDIEKSRNFCQDLGITYLPDKDRKSYYELVKDKFETRVLIPEEHFNLNDLLFDEKTLDKFENGNPVNVLFVVDDGRIKGVVHIVDYNRKFIFFEFYKLLFTYEKMVRKLLELSGEDNDSFLNYLKQKSEKEQAQVKKKETFWTGLYINCIGDKASEIERRKDARLKLGPFQDFYLHDLLVFCNSKRILKITNQDSLTRIRNRIAHSVDIIKLEKGPIGRALYDCSGLTEFRKDACRFFQNYEILEDKLYKVKSEKKRKAKLACK